jgi:hypothetical protein
VIFVEVFNVAATLAVLVGMYHGIEIGHPVFAVLFADLVTI